MVVGRWQAPLSALLLMALAMIDPASAAPSTSPDGQPVGSGHAGQTVESHRSGERILSFVSDITINRDASLSVVDTIRVRAEGSQIRRGIYRDFSTVRSRHGGTGRVRFQVQGVTRNGQPELYSAEVVDSVFAVRIGREDVMLPPGEHIYQIRYVATGEISFLDSHDELFWNVTGGGWAFPIDHAEAVIRLPQAVRFGSRTVYAGGPEGDGRNAEVFFEQPGEIRIRITAPLDREQGFSVTVGWPKGVVEGPLPTAAQQ